MKTSKLIGYALNGEVHKLAYPDELIKEGCTAPPYSSDWAFGGPIIEEHGIHLEWSESHEHSGWRTHGWLAYSWDRFSNVNYHCALGDTALVAAMRCYVASKLGEKIEIPKELI